ncbi:MAG: type II toxin-antitoxin system HicB family antitoxin [Oscillospiraceae bacterium]|jgi:predicted RNase H-like HicB family nuclease|nr:type II toxin-antitoxin system HicB family antitoxin [Oscillospiraceae bacterium]
MKLVYPACFYRNEENDGFTAVFPDLPGCVTCGSSLAESALMAEDAASGWVLDEMEDGNEIPQASAIDSVVPDDGGFVSLVALDMDSYAEKYGNKAIRKNLTIPAWLNTFAEAKGVNFSKVLQNALESMYHQSVK